ncbi:MAG: AMP-binding protein [Candidatus Adiutrix sp.]|nr:AMP-binding protein [Candidatus Adiutrix sp.]
MPGAAAETSWLAELAEWGPTCLVGVPTQMAALGRHPLANRLTLKTMLLSGEVAEDRLVRELEQNFPGCRVFRHYGLTEAGLGGAVECERRLWPHLRDDLWAEIIGPDGRPQPPGAPGEITLTPLTRLAMPLIRYRTGDEGLILASPCPCGSQMNRLQIFGRLADRFTLPSGRSLRAGDFEAPLADLPFIRGYDLKLHPHTALTLSLLTTPGAPGETPRLAAEAIAAWLGPGAAGLTLAVILGHQLEGSGKRRLERTAEPPEADFIASW